MRRFILSAVAVAVLVVGTGLVDAQRAEAAPYFSFSVGTPGYYQYPVYPGYPYGVAPVPQTYFYGSVVPRGPAFGYAGYPYGAYYGGYRPYYGHHYRGYGRW